MRILVTGAAGFIGSHIVDRLLTMGFEVYGLDNLSNGVIDNLCIAFNYDNFKFLRADLLDSSSCMEFFNGVDVVFHFAANPEVRHSFREPLDHYRNNVEATLNVLEFCRKFNIKYMVFASSSTVYGDPDFIPTPEFHPIKPISVYGATKAACEILCKVYSELYNVKSLILRYANIVGPRSNHGVIIDFINKLKLNSKILEILGDGTQIKSYLYIDDAIDATIMAFKNFILEGLNFEIYNIGSMDQICVKDIASIIISIMGLHDVQYIYKTTTSNGRGWPGDVKIMLLDTSKISKKTGWKAKYNSRESIVKTVQNIINPYK
ncbi:MAG: GDP-mannose 4,6-dehydratase [Candidatus Methanomethylicia archaeon]|nr:GDP-mannose 4,6-dehydratase [Candidatus Methanomethylicia archaeon]